MAVVEQKGRFLAEFERRKTPCEILRLVRHRSAGCALPKLFHVHAYVDDQLLEAAARTAKAAFAKAIEWRVVGRLTDVSINDGARSYSIAEFASVMALAEMANTAASTEQKAFAEKS